MEIIRSLEHVTRDDLFASFSEAFRDYPISWDRAAFDAMLQRRQFTPHLSFGAFHEERLVSFTLNGIGIYNGIKTAYDSGTGTVKEYREKGLATKIFQSSLPPLRNEGIRQYLLEVLKDNITAQQVYKAIGFNITRALDYYKQDVASLKIRTQLPDGYHITTAPLPAEEMVKHLWSFLPSWQNSEACLQEKDRFQTIEVFFNKDLAGYAIIEIATGDIPQIAVHPAHRNKGVGSALLTSLLPYNQKEFIRLANAEDGDDSWKGFMKRNNLIKIADQYEMIIKL